MRRYETFLSVVAGRGRTRRTAAPAGEGAAFEGRKFGILAFALQCVSVRLLTIGLAVLFLLEKDWFLALVLPNLNRSG